MIAKKEAEAIIEENLDMVRLKRIIRNTSMVAWNKIISEDKIDNWLENFDGKYFEDIESERKLALWLLAHFTYYTYNDIRRLCKKLFDEFIHEKLVQVEKNEDISGLIDDILDNTLFVGLGNDSESGNNILYYFRQENGLSKTNFEIRTGKTYDNLVYIDDLSISGDQALEYMESRSISANHVYSAILISTEDALKRIRESSMDVKPITAVILDNRDRAFSNLSYVFSDSRMNPIRLCAKDFCEYYGKIAVEKDGYMSNYPLGYSDGQYLIGFEYNTPDNTLPIFWGYKNGWKPLFKRYPKKYEGEEYTLDGRKYY